MAFASEGSKVMVAANAVAARAESTNKRIVISFVKFDDISRFRFAAV
jgi:hypothetical protein